MKGIFFMEELKRRMESFIELAQKDGQVVAVYLFGSYTSGRHTPLSDVDVAVLLDKSTDRNAYFDKRLSLMAELSAALGTDNPDLVILNEAPPPLAYRHQGRAAFIYPEQCPRPAY